MVLERAPVRASISPSLNWKDAVSPLLAQNAAPSPETTTSVIQGEAKPPL